ncbi:MAG: crotonase/enoyl-CoA hydratase family protein [Acidimicrobiales bacterium]
MSEEPHLLFERDGHVAIITLNRPEKKNALSGEMLVRMYDAWLEIDRNPEIRVAIVTGAGGNFCSGADLKAMAAGHPEDEYTKRFAQDPDLHWKALLRHFVPGKPLIAAVEGYAVAGGLELAIWCDLRVAAVDAVFAVSCRRWGVPLVDGGTVRLPRLVGHGNALDLILTGRSVGGEEARMMGLVNRLTPPGEALAHAVELARELARFPQGCLRGDRRSCYEQWDLDLPSALRNETEIGLGVIASGETLAGATRFVAGAGRHGRPDEGVPPTGSDGAASTK